MIRIGLVGIDGSHAEDFLRHFNAEGRHHDIRVTALWGRDAPVERLGELLALSPGIDASASLEDLIDAADAVVVGDRHGDLHLRHALPCIAAGKPVFTDKPLACSIADAEAIVDAAERAGVPLLSGSALRWQDETVVLKERLAHVDGPLTLRAHGTWYPDSEYGGPIFYAIHTVELVQELIGIERDDLQLLENGEHPVFRYQAGPKEVLLSFNPLGESGSSDFGVKLSSGQMTLDRNIPLGDDYMLPVVNRIAHMLHTGQGGMTPEALLAPIRMISEIDTLLRASP